MDRSRRQSAFVLLVTMVVLVVLSAIVAGLALQLKMSKRRQDYMIEYQRARYGVDSALKYIYSEIPRKNFRVVSRKDKPDFSDLFLMNEKEYAQYITTWAATATDDQIDAVLKKEASSSPAEPLSTAEMISQLASMFAGLQEDPNDMTAGDDWGSGDSSVTEIDPNDIQVPGPYGPQWPYTIEPIELEIGPARITITIEDENAKMPLSWLVSASGTRQPRVQHALEAYCEWMVRSEEDLKILEKTIESAADEIYKRKIFTMNAGPILLKKTTTTTATTTRSTATTTRTVTQRRQPARSTTTTTTQTKTEQRPAIAHTTDFAKLFNSSLLDRELLDRPLSDTGRRVESPLKYLGLWGSQHVNINTAPRHVLEAAFTMVMEDAFRIPELVQQVIEHRQEKPFTKVDELRELGRLDSETVNKLNTYFTTVSTFFKVRVTSRSGVARATAVMTVVKEGTNFEKLAVLYEQ